jgi:hypothetical protein
LAGVTCSKAEYQKNGPNVGHEPAMVTQNVKACERALIKSLWNRTYILWIFGNKEHRKNDNHAVAEYRKNDNHSVAEYKQWALHDKLRDHYNKFALGDLPLNPLQSHHFDIQLDHILLLSYDTRKSLLISADLYISRTMAFDNLARRSEAQYILQNTTGPRDVNMGQ